MRKVCRLCCAVCLPVFSFYCFLFYHKRLVGFPSPPTSISTSQSNISFGSLLLAPWCVRYCCGAEQRTIIEFSSKRPRIGEESTPRRRRTQFMIVVRFHACLGTRCAFCHHIRDRRVSLLLPSTTSVFWPARHGTWLCFFSSFWWREDSQRQFRQRVSATPTRRKIDESPKNKVRLITIVNLLIPFLVVQTL